MTERHYRTRQSDIRQRYVMTRPVVTSFAASVFLGGLIGLVNLPTLEATVVGQALPGRWEILWDVVYTLAGALIVLGVVQMRSRIEAAGLCLLASSMAVWGACVFDVRGFPDGFLGASVFLGICVGAWWRAYLLTVGLRVVK